MILQMSVLKHSLESAGFAQVKTILSSGNVAFDSPRRNQAAPARGSGVNASVLQPGVFRPRSGRASIYFSSSRRFPLIGIQSRWQPSGS